MSSYLSPRYVTTADTTWYNCRGQPLPLLCHYERHFGVSELPYTDIDNGEKRIRLPWSDTARQTAENPALLERGGMVSK
eukprot:scaffold53052_cov22-Tisochrysis_lutea.AAC.1